jgi:hypothetical protein
MNMRAYRQATTYRAAGLWLVLASLAVAQEQGRERYEAAGSVRAVAPGAVQVLTAENGLVSVKLPTKPADISFTANADPSFLRPGLVVRFSAVPNKRWQITEPITSLTVFTPLERGDLGVYPENAGGSGPNPLGGIFSDPQSERQPKKKPTRKVAEEVPYRIGGTIVSIKANKMVVAAGGTQIKCEVADDVKVKVSLANLSYARLGDKVEIEGWHYPARKQAGVLANRISVTAVEPLTGEKKTRPGAKEDEKDSPEDEKPEEEKKSE